MNELVSVVISTYNRCQDLQRAIVSVLQQNYEPLEVLICDDGSDDGTEQMVGRIGDSRVRWFPGVHAGRPAVPKNRGIVQSRGSWVAFLDHDDQWMPDKLHQQLQLATSLRCQAVCANMRKVIPGQGFAGNMLSDRMQDINRITFMQLLRMNVVMSSTAMVRRSVLAETGGFPESPELSVNDDYALWLKVSMYTDFAYLHKPLVHYQWDGANLSAQQQLDFWEDKRRVLREFLLWSTNYPIVPGRLAAAKTIYEQALAQVRKVSG